MKYAFIFCWVLSGFVAVGTYRAALRHATPHLSMKAREARYDARMSFGLGLLGPVGLIVALVQSDGFADGFENPLSISFYLPAPN